MFTSAIDLRETVQPFKDYTLREQEIARHQRLTQLKGSDAAGSPKAHIPKRLRGQAVALIKKLQKLHSRCSYAELLRHYCPPIVISSSPIVNIVAKNLIQQVIDYDRGRIDRSQDVQMSCSESLGGKKGKNSSYSKSTSQELSLVDFATPASHVSAFCRAALSNLIPHDFWGAGKEADENQKVIMQHVDRFIRLRRFENFSLHLLSQKLKVKRCPSQVGRES